MSRQFASLTVRGRVRAAATAALLLVAGLFASSLGAAPSGAASPPTRGVGEHRQLRARRPRHHSRRRPTDAVPAVWPPRTSTTIIVTISVSDGSEPQQGHRHHPRRRCATDSRPTPTGTFTPGDVHRAHQGIDGHLPGHLLRGRRRHRLAGRAEEDHQHVSRGQSALVRRASTRSSSPTQGDDPATGLGPGPATPGPTPPCAASWSCSKGIGSRTPPCRRAVLRPRALRARRSSSSRA